ncbi:MAG: gamma-glutamylcyclotransferase [Kiloniellales bacterium]|nr:gamma-glutamylcyclotransferase [Kiloniellales bacterium]
MSSRTVTPRPTHALDPSARPPGARRLRLTPGEDIWVFAYGSLMWNPGFPHLEVRRAWLYGFHRRFCIYSHVYRGTPERPGLVLGLDRGGSCQGLAFRVPPGEAGAVMDYLYDRELVTDVYIPRWVRLATRDGEVRAASFVVDRSHHQYTGELDLEATAALIRQGFGVSGPGIDYLRNTVRHMEALGLASGYLGRVLRAVERHERRERHERQRRERRKRRDTERRDTERG